MLAMVGIPLGISSRKGGRSAGYIWAIFLAFFCYYLGYIALTGLARSHSMGVELASWLPNAAFGLAGIVMIARMEAPGDRDLLGSVRQCFAGWFFVALASVAVASRRHPPARRRDEVRAFSDTRQLRALELSFLFLCHAGLFRHDDAGFYFFRPAGRYRQEQRSDVARGQVPRFSYAGTDLRYSAASRFWYRSSPPSAS